MLYDSDRSRVIAYHTREIGNILLLWLYYYPLEYIWMIIGDRAEWYFGSGLGWHSSEARVALVLPVSVKDRPLHWVLVRSHTYYPEHILIYGSGKARCSLVVGSGSFRTDWLETGKGGGLCTILRPSPKCGGLESKFRRGPRHPWQSINEEIRLQNPFLN